MSMDYKILKKFNNSTTLIYIDNEIRIVKKITAADVLIYRKLKNIENDNLSAVYDVVENDGRIYAVTEYVQGETIEEYIRKNGPADEKTVIRVVKAICSGLDVLHKNDIVHRDISANNIIINQNNIKLIDFGISRIYKTEKGRDTQILGTQGYAAPEQFGFKQSSPRSDIYSIGVLMNYMLTGKFPYEELYYGNLSNVINKCIEIDEAKRYQSVNQLKSVLANKKFMSGIYAVPGFRSNKLYKKMIATVYYIAAVFMCFTLSWDDQMHIPSFRHFICWFLIGLFTLIIPVFLIFNYRNWSDRLLKNASRQNKIIIRIFAAVLCYIIAFIIPSPM